MNGQNMQFRENTDNSQQMEELEFNKREQERKYYSKI